ncbi:alcohol dehydrogenase catalytic domain-containing protein [Cupriavidus consociatus]|uniref:alcohol dehydrogenase catalytic domain-containing protein n=1 Tax=Cupriavidus consociatus TaxID=2821357 RepID=UPI001AE85AF4|nr:MULTISPECIES: alcohol dehydrogenase catalytic domain-containing protein [unclassified Cupriavidus]MBP0623678.1 alcohol dehydrogenase catalytic domain-containing protein [Cupriavidus sp. LEh25]MDK2660382.1 alcohol dehydrogenase catalytic domain-containing protein [Cupriavidus sp. LEh21]
MKSTYRAMQITRPGFLELVERATPLPDAGEVLIRVEACGMCGADIGDIEQANPAHQPPRVPGHEIVGRIIAVGANTPAMWKTGMRVGLGRLGGHCNACTQCRRGQFQLCQNQSFVGANCDGGYAEIVRARATGLVSIPDELSAEEAAPLLCAGIATFNALRKSGAQAGDLVAILGIGGLGHMAIQYARKMGFKVIAVGRGSDIAKEVAELGAHGYLDTDAADAAEALQRMGGAQAVISTIGDAEAVSGLLPALVPQGRLVVLGGTKNPLSVQAGHLVVGERELVGSITGTPYESEAALAFSVLVDARPRFESMPLAKAGEAYQRLKRGDVKFRIVLTMGADPA